MKRKTFALSNVVGALIATGAATAGFLGLSVEPFVGEGWMANGYGNTALTTWRVYAQFDGQGDDGVQAVFATAEDRSQVLASAVYNALAFAGNTAPFHTFLGVWDNQWDTYVTINATDDRGDETTLSEGFSEETHDLCGSWDSPTASWFVPPASDQGIGTNVFIAQITTEEDHELLGLRWNIRTREGQELFGLESGSTTCWGDLSHNKVVDFSDILVALRLWGPCNDCFEDLDCSGDVGIGDLLEILQHWGESCV